MAKQPLPAQKLHDDADEFLIETKFVVLNFFGHVSMDSSLNSSQTNSLRSTRSQSSSSDELAFSQEADGGSLSRRSLQNLPNVCMLDKYRQSHAAYQQDAGSATWTRDTARATHEEVLKEINDRRPPDSPVVRPTFIRLPAVRRVAESDQDSDTSEESEGGSTAGRSVRSVMSNTSVVDMLPEDVERLVNMHALPMFAVPLREELSLQLHHLQRISDLAVGRMGAMSPESEVAYCLGQIGDQVQEDYSAILGQLTKNVLSLPRDKVTYSVYRRLVNELIISSSGWSRVALLMLLAQKIVFLLLSRGERYIGPLTDYTARLIEESSADFVVSSGGWNAVRDIDSPVSAASWQPWTPEEGRAPVGRPFQLEAIQETDDPVSSSDSAISVMTPLSSQGALSTRDISSDSFLSCVLTDGGLADTTDANDPRTVPDSLPVSTQPAPSNIDSPISELVRNDIRLLRMYSDEIVLDHAQEARWCTLRMVFAVAALAVAVVVYSKCRQR